MNYKEVGMRNTEVIAETKMQEEAIISRTLSLALDRLRLSPRRNPGTQTSFVVLSGDGKKLKIGAQFHKFNLKSTSVVSDSVSSRHESSGDLFRPLKYILFLTDGYLFQNHQSSGWLLWPQLSQELLSCRDKPQEWLVNTLRAQTLRSTSSWVTLSMPVWLLLQIPWF